MKIKRVLLCRLGTVDLNQEVHGWWLGDSDKSLALVGKRVRIIAEVIERPKESKCSTTKS